MAVRRAVFLDKDGTVIDDVPYNVDPSRIRLSAGVPQGLRRLQDAGYALVIVSNQSGVARGLFPEKALTGVWARLEDLLAKHGISLAGFYYCPHHPEGVIGEYSRECECRKPAPGMILRAAADLQIDLATSWLIGDILNDVEAGHRAGCRSILVDNGNETEWVFSPERRPDAVVTEFASAADVVLAMARTERDIVHERTTL